MKKHFFGILMVALFMSFCLCLAPNGTWADFGGFSGNSDYGGSSHSGGGGGWSGGGGSHSSYSGGGDLFAAAAVGSFFSSDGDDWMLAVIVLVVVGIIFLNQNKKKSQQGSAPVYIEPEPVNRNLKPISSYLALDPQFDEAKLRAHLANLYVQMQDAWHNKDISFLRPYMTDAFYNQMDRQLDALRKARRTDCTENIAVLDTNILGYWQSAGMDYLAVRLKTRIVSYILDDRTGNVVSGEKDREKFMEYEWELVRKTGVLTSDSQTQTVNCPYCGAPLKINASAQCSYCGSVVSVLNEDWAVSGMKGISQRTA